MLKILVRDTAREYYTYKFNLFLPRAERGFLASKLNKSGGIKVKNLTTLKELELEEIMAILDRAKSYKNGEEAKSNNKRKVIANLFFEPSSRTLYSFVMAEKKLGYDEIEFNAEASSLKKGETLFDTVRLFEELGVCAVVIRAKEDKYYENLVGKLSIPVLNAGDGKGDHPTQSLLDLMTIREEFGKFSGLKVLISGDIRYSRVAKTNIEVMERLGMEVSIAAPKELRDEKYKYIENIDDLSSFDVVMLLRVQHERHDERFSYSKEEYLEKFGLNKKRYDSMKETAIIMHPAPFNRGWEIDSDLVESDKSRIFKQMHNGVFVRMAVIERALGE